MDFGTQIFNFFSSWCNWVQAIWCLEMLYVQWVLCHFITHFGHVSQKQRGQKQYIWSTHTQICIIIITTWFFIFSHSEHCFFIESIFHLIWVFELEVLEISYSWELFAVFSFSWLFVCLFVFFFFFFFFWVVISLSGSQDHGWWNECYELVIQ